MDESPATVPRRGRVLRGDGFRLEHRNSVSVGSDGGCDVVVEGADPRHAELRWDPDRGAWFLRDDLTPGKTYLNADPIADGRLFEGDVIGIAGVKLLFAGKRLRELKPDDPRGTTVAVRGLSASARARDGGGTKLLDGVSFEVEAGSFTAILGPSGCGKSTLIQRLAGFPLDGEVRGDVFLGGERLVPGDPRLLRSVAYLPQSVEDSLHPGLSVRETMEDFRRCHLAPGADPDFAAALDAVQMKWSVFADKPVRELSGGEKRRLALALELLRDPKLLLLDEPTAGLDPAAEAGVMALLRRLSGPGKKTVLCATHVLGSLAECRNVLVMAPGGRIAFHGTPAGALAHFGAGDWLSVYRRLSDRDCPPWKCVEPGEPAPREPGKPNGGPAAPARAAFAATFARLFRSAFRKRNLPLFAGVPVAVSLLLLLASGSLFDDREEGTVYFCMAVAMFWFGLSGSFRALVSERVPKRCLDRMRGMPLGRYFAAHVAFALFSSFVQSLLFVLPVFAWRLGHAPDFAPGAFPAFWFDLALVGFCGGCAGLAVSAAAKTELYAAWSLPLVAIPVLFLSKPVLEGGRGKPSGVLRAVECAMPTPYPQTLLETTMDRAKAYAGTGMPLDRWRRRPDKRDPKTGAVVRDAAGKPVPDRSWSDKHVLDVLRFFALVAGYAVVCSGLAFALQDWRERRWDGR